MVDQDRLYRFSLAVLPRVYVWLTRIWFATCREEVIGGGHALLDRYVDKGVIACFWHYSFAYVFYHLRHYRAVVMVSASRDGAYIARVAELLGYETVRGSANRQGASALRKIIQAMRQGKSGGIVGDGSQGPPRRLQAGAILMASLSGRPVVPLAWAPNRYWSFNSWDRTVVPLPFSRIVVCYGEPVHVPRHLGEGELEQYRRLLEKRLNQVYHQAWSRMGRQAHDGVTEARQAN